MEWFARSRDIPALVEDGRDLGVGMMVQQSVDLRHHGRWCLTQLPGAPRQWQGNRLGSTPAEADAHGDVITPGERDVLDQEPHHALALAVSSVWIVPQPREVSGKGEDPVSLFGVQLVVILLAAPFEFFLCLLKCPQLLIPLRFQDIGHQTVARVDLHEPTAGQIGVIASPLDLFLAQGVGFVNARVEFGVDL